MKRLVLFAAVVSLGAQASASFELMYIPVLAENRVARYDPVNRMFLGGFNVPGARRVMSGNQQLGAIRGGNGQYRFNMFNGLQLGYIPISMDTGSFDRTTGDVILPSSSFLNSANITTGVTSGTPLVGAGTGTPLFGNRISNGMYALARNDAGVLRTTLHLGTGGLVSTGATNSLNSISFVSNSIHWKNRQGTDVVTSALYDTSLSQWRLYHMVRTSTGLFATSLGLNVANFAATQPVSLVPAHNGFYVVGADLTNPGTLTRFTQYDDDGNGFFYDSWTTSLNVSGNNIFGVGTVIAPEPGTMIALGAGVLAFLKRRRKV